MASNLQHTISIHTKDVTGLAFSDSLLATCSGDKTIRLWDVQSGYIEVACSPLCGHTYAIRGCVFSPDFSQLATCSTDGKVILWNVANGAKESIFEHPSKCAICVCKFSPDGKLLATGSDDCRFCIWDVKKQKQVRLSDNLEESVVALAFSPDGSYLASSTTHGEICLWDGQYGHGKYLVRQTEAHDLGVTCLEFSPTYGSAGQIEQSIMSQRHFMLASAGQDNLVKLWDVLAFVGSTKVQMTLRNTLTGHSSPVMALAFSPSGKLLASGGNDKSIKLWNPLKGEAFHTIEGHSRFVSAVAFSADGSVLASGSNDKLVKIWKLNFDSQATDSLHLDELCLNLNGQKLEPDFLSWSNSDVVFWLKSIQLDGYIEVFEKSNTRGHDLQHLNHQNLIENYNIESLPHRNRLIQAIADLQDFSRGRSRLSSDGQVPDEYLCPITREIMSDPTIASDGYTYERHAIESWIKDGKNRSPMTNAPLTNTTLTPNRSLKMLIQKHPAKQVLK